MDIFPFIRMDLVAYGVADLEPPWVLRPEVGRFHYLYAVRRGPCWFETLDDRDAPRKRVRLDSGDLVGVTNGIPHALRDSLGTPLPAPGRSFPVRPLDRSAKPRGSVALLVGWVPCHVDPLSRLYPEVILVPRRDPSGRNRSIWRLLRLVEEEIAANAEGRDSVLRRLSEIIVVELLRAVMAQEKEPNPAWLCGLADERLARLAAAIQRNPGMRWTLGEMGRVAGLSRSALETAFLKVLGQTPKRYLTRVRMRKAALELVAGRHSTAEVASSLGYESESAFHRAFKRVTGMTVGQLRRLSKNGATGPAIALALLGSPAAPERTAAGGSSPP